ncbi:hypothetical protein V5D56_10510 [Cellulosimicrobium sp. PMB13]|uniref:hypothetical protein n=1 Tax=Cellulosimicrobium sp. PMB13 TaxID=3120158 RepID=UPI003F4C3A77
MTLPPGLHPRAHDDAGRRSPYAPGGADRARAVRPGGGGTTTRRRVVVGLVCGGTALVVGGIVAFSASYLATNADAVLASPDDLPADGWSDDEWYGDEWPDDEVWSDAPGGGTLSEPWPVGATVYGPRWDVTLGTPRDATAEILAADPSGAAPGDGTEYWVVPTSAVHWGPGSAVKTADSVTLAFVTPDGSVHSTPCATVPGELVTEGRVPVEATLVGNLCVEVPSGADGVWRLTVGAVEPVFLAVDEG